MTIQAMPLPYAKGTLQPHISSETFDYHYDKHYKNYVNKLNILVKGSKFEKMSLNEIIKQSSGNIYNNAAQVWNHEFYWKGLSKDNNLEEKKLFLSKINKKEDDLKNHFIEKAMQLFGSGWCWFTINKNNEFELINKSNADIPNENKILLTCDVWEHAYYIDYRNDRLKYLEDFWKLINWKFLWNNLSS